MRLRGITRSRNIEDRRGRRGRRGGAVGGLGIGGILVVLVIGWVTGVDVMPLLSGGSAPATASRPLTEADAREGEFAARMIGDDHLQRQAGRVPQPHTFTHGTSEQRARWFERGYDSGNMRDCDTFATDRL